VGRFDPPPTVPSFPSFPLQALQPIIGSNNVTMHDLSSIFDHFVRVTFSQGEPLSLEGREVDRLLIIMDGAVSGHTLSGDSAGRVDFELGPGQCIGMAELLSVSTFTATAVATTPKVYAMALDRFYFTEMCDLVEMKRRMALVSALDIPQLANCNVEELAASMDMLEYEAGDDVFPLPGGAYHCVNRERASRRLPARKNLETEVKSVTTADRIRGRQPVLHCGRGRGGVGVLRERRAAQSTGELPP
jgi:hypothetical protein